MSEREGPRNWGPTTPKNERWYKVLHLVASGEWYGVATAYELSHEWGISIDTVSRYRTEAVRTLRVMVDDDLRNEVRAILASRLDRIYKEAMDKHFVLDASGKEHPVADCKSAIQSVRAHASLYGLLQKDNRAPWQDFADLLATKTDEQIKAELSTIIGANGNSPDFH